MVKTKIKENMILIDIKKGIDTISKPKSTEKLLDLVDDQSVKFNDHGDVLGWRINSALYYMPYVIFVVL